MVLSFIEYMKNFMFFYILRNYLFIKCIIYKCIIISLKDFFIEIVNLSLVF